MRDKLPIFCIKCGKRMKPESRSTRSKLHEDYVCDCGYKKEIKFERVKVKIK